MSESKTVFPTYRGKPLVRCGDTLYFGDMNETHVAKIDIKSKKTVGDLQVADKVIIQLILTDPDASMKKRIEKTSERNGLYQALDIADIWLTRKQSEK